MSQFVRFEIHSGGGAVWVNADKVAFFTEGSNQASTQLSLDRATGERGRTSLIVRGGPQDVARRLTDGC